MSGKPLNTSSLIQRLSAVCCIVFGQTRTHMHTVLFLIFLYILFFEMCALERKCLYVMWHQFHSLNKSNLFFSLSSWFIFMKPVTFSQRSQVPKEVPKIAAVLCKAIYPWRSFLVNLKPEDNQRCSSTLEKRFKSKGNPPPQVKLIYLNLQNFTP